MGRETLNFDPKWDMADAPYGLLSDRLRCNYRWHRVGLGDKPHWGDRDFIKAIVGLVAKSPLLAQAQQNGRLTRIAAFMPFTGN